MASIQRSIGVGGSLVGKNEVEVRSMYRVNGGGAQRINNLVNVFYTNVKLLQMYANCPKLIVGTEKLKQEDINIISVAEVGYKWSKLLEKQLKFQLRPLKGMLI